MSALRAPSPHVLDLAARDDLGLGPHYLTIWSMVVGLEARHTWEFGAGGSTAVILDALESMTSEDPSGVPGAGGPPEGAGGPLRHHGSCSTDPAAYVQDRNHFAVPPGAHWTHHQGLSERVTEAVGGGISDWPSPPFDFVLHDGSHTEEVVAEDLLWALGHLRQFGLCVVHDTQHSVHGPTMRAGVRKALWKLSADDAIGFSHTTLPYSFGLTILRRETPWANGEAGLVPQRGKVGSSARTEPCTLMGGKP